MKKKSEKTIETDLTFKNAPEILKPVQVQKLLQISRTTFFRWVTNGELPGAFKIGDSWRVDRDKLRTWIDRQTEQLPDVEAEQIKDTSKVELIT